MKAQISHNRDQINRLQSVNNRRLQRNNESYQNNVALNRSRVSYPQRSIPQYNPRAGMQDQHLRFLNNQVNMINRIYDENDEDDGYPHNNMSMMMDSYDHGNVTEDNVNRSYQEVDMVRRGSKLPKRNMNRNHHQ